MIGNMIKQAWEFKRTNRKTHEYVWKEGQGKLHSQAKIRNYDRNKSTDCKNTWNAESIGPDE